jgi:predicted transposase YbfD/YdcC
MVSAWAADMGLLLGRCKVDGKSNEIKAIPQLLRLLHLKGCIVTTDTIGCQKSIAQQLHEHGADYAQSLKGNQRHMHAVVQRHFGVQTSQEPLDESTYTESSSGHGRQEMRSYRVSPMPEALQRAAVHWPGLSSAVQVTRQRQQTGSDASAEVSYCLSSLAAHTPAQVRGAQYPFALEPGCGDARRCRAVLQRPGAAQPDAAKAHGAAVAQE